MSEWILPTLLGAATGILSAWGVGGGTLLLLCMTLFLGVEQRTAQAINLLFFLPTAGIGLLFHRRQGFLDHAVWQTAAPAGVLAALVGSLVALTVDPDLLRPPFGIFLLYAGGSLLWNTWRKPNSNPSKKNPGDL